MIIYLPCRLGETFTPLKFDNWVDGKRVYRKGPDTTLTGFDAFDCQTRSLAIPTIITPSGFYSYDPEGEFSQEFIPKYKISVDVKTEKKLCDWGFTGKRTVRLTGLNFDKYSIMADFVTNDRYEHLRYQIMDTIKYVAVEENPPETIIKPCKVNEDETQITIFSFL